MHKLFSIGLVFCFIGLLSCMFCSSPGVEKVSSPGQTIYRLQDDYYVKRIVVDVEVLFVRCDKDGNLLSGPITVHYGKNRQTTVIGE